MKHLSRMNPSQRKFPSTSGPSIPVRGVGKTVRANSDVTTFILGISIFLFFFLCAVGDRWTMIIAAFAVPIAAAVAVALSNLGEGLVWPWAVSATYCALGFLWVGGLIAMGG